MPKQAKRAKKGSSGQDILTELESRQARLYALLHSCDVQDHAIRDAAMQMHDSANRTVQQLDTKLRKQGDRFDGATARAYGTAIQKRADAQGIILKQRTRHWDDGPGSAL